MPRATPRLELEGLGAPSLRHGLRQEAQIHSDLSHSFGSLSFIRISCMVRVTTISDSLHQAHQAHQVPSLYYLGGWGYEGGVMGMLNRMCPSGALSLLPLTLRR